MKLSIVIPVYQDTSALHELLQRIFHVADTNHYEASIVIVDDGSRQAAWDEIDKLKANFPDKQITRIRLAKNHGQHLATLCGIMNSNGDLIVTLDADLQHSPEAMPTLIRTLLQRKLDLIYGTSSSGHSLARRLASKVYLTLAWVAGTSPLNPSAYRVMTSELARHLESSIYYAVYDIDENLRKVSSKAGSISVKHNQRKHGASSYTWPKLIKEAGKRAYHSRYLKRAITRLGLGSSAILIICAYSTQSSALYFLFITLIIINSLLILTSYAISARRERVSLSEQINIREVRE